MVVGRLLSYWEGNFSGAMLNFGRVYVRHVKMVYFRFDMLVYQKMSINLLRLQ